jgi:hypothetical protein
LTELHGIDSGMMSVCFLGCEKLAVGFPVRPPENRAGAWQLLMNVRRYYRPYG